MKKIILSFALLLSLHVFSQGCDYPWQYCIGGTNNLPLTTAGSVSQPMGLNYGCISSKPNLTFFYFNVNNPGNLVLGIEGSKGGLVDAICWGPYTTPFGQCGVTNTGNIVDCSYSSVPGSADTIRVPNALAGQFYVLCVANYTDSVQNVIINQISGTGSTHCDSNNCNISSPASLCFVNTNNTPNNEIYFNHTTFGVRGTIIYRKNSVNTWDSIGYVPSSQPDEFTDLTANPNQQNYSYCTAQLDSCGNVHATSSPHTTILLQSSLGTTGQINLTWNAYIGVSTNTYYIYRGASPTTMTLLTQVSSSNLAYTDVNPLSGNNYYKVAIKAPLNCTSNASHDTLIGSNYRTNAVTGIDYLSNTDLFNIYPNPTNSNINVYSFEIGKSIEITDVLGNSVLIVIPQSNKETIDLQKLNKGIYFIKNTNSKGIFCKKFVLE